MKSNPNERIEHHVCPDHIAKSLLLAGGKNRFGEPNFRVIWGWNRIVPITGEWQDFERELIPDLSPFARPGAVRLATRLVRSVVETRQVPKYLPGNCWHLEMWRPPEEYGSPETWGKIGEEIIGCLTVDTAGPFPSRGEYELCYPITSDLTSDGQPITCIEGIVDDLVYMIMASRERFTALQRKAAIEQEQAKHESGFVRITQERLRDSLRPFAGEEFVVRP